MNSSHSIVLVHLGPVFFNYINDCIEQIKKFNDCNIYLITEESHRNKVVNTDLVNFISLSSIISTAKHNRFNESTKLDQTFRDGFWKFATERFFVLEEVIEKYNLENVFHIENDNLIYCDLERYLSVFTENYNVAAILESDDRVIPSFMYFKNLQCISGLTDFILRDSNSDDMHLLSLYKEQGNAVKNLPILPSNYDLEFKSKVELTTKNKEQYFNNIEKFNSLFDGAAKGQYIGGVDPRNIEGDTTGHVNECALFDTSKFKFEFRPDAENRKIPYLIYKDMSYPINNLHIHCKDLKKFVS